MNEKVTALTKHEEPQASNITPMVAMIERVAMDPTIPIDRLEQMLAMKERLDAKAAEVAFNEAFAACQAEMPKVIARHNNEQTRSKYAKLADVYSVAKPIATAHGFSFSTFPAKSDKEGFQGIRWELRHSSGHVVGDTAEVPTDDRGMKGTQNKTATHAFGSTISYGRRYIFCMVFDIATDDDDDGMKAGRGATINADQYEELSALLADPIHNEAAFLKYMRVNALEDIPAAKFNDAKSALLAKKREGGQK